MAQGARKCSDEGLILGFGFVDSDEPRDPTMASDYNPLDDLPVQIRRGIASPVPSHFSIVTGSPSPTLVHNQQVMSPRAPLGQTSANTQQHRQQTAATESAGNIAADGSVVFRSLSQVVLPADMVSRLQALQNLELGQLADLDHIRQGMQALADELVRRSELLGQCVQRAANGTLEDRENIQSLHQALQALQQSDAHHQTRIASLSSEHERTNSAGEQKQLLVSMLEKQATALEQVTAKQSSSEEKIEQLKQSLDMAQFEAARAKARYEDDLKTTRWVVNRVTRLEMLVDKLRAQDATIRQELEIDPEQGIRLAAAGHDADGKAPSVVHHVLSPENPGDFYEGYEEDWWGTGHPVGHHDAGAGEKRYFQWDAYASSCPPGLGPSAQPPPLPEGMKRVAPAVEVKIPQAAFKLLKDAPKLDLSAGGEPWEVGMTVHQWRVETRTVMTAIHPSFADYFDKIGRGGAGSRSFGIGG